MNVRRAILSILCLFVLVQPSFANEFYTASGAPAQGSAGSSAAIRSEFGSIASGFNLLPTMGGNGNNLVTVNGAGTALVATTPFTTGVWTASVGGSATYSNQTGIYYKVGTQVFAQLNIAISSIGTGSTTVITGLPFAADSSSPYSCWVGYFINLASNVVFLSGQVSATQITLQSLTVAAGATTANAVLGNNTSIQMGCLYRSTS